MITGKYSIKKKRRGKAFVSNALQHLPDILRFGCYVTLCCYLIAGWYCCVAVLLPQLLFT